MKKYETIKRPEIFDVVIKTGKSIKTKYFVMCYKPNSENNSKFGIAVSKKVGNAVIRNKLKRRYRNIIDNNKILFKKSTNYIIIIRKESLNANFDNINNIMKSILEKGEI